MNQIQLPKQREKQAKATGARASKKFSAVAGRQGILKDKRGSVDTTDQSSVMTSDQ